MPASSNRGSRCTASLSPTSSGASAWASAVNGRSAGVHASADHPAGRAGSTPALRNELLPAPDGPITALSRGRRNWRSSDSTSCSRPKKKRASVLRERQKAGIRALLSATHRPGAGARALAPARLRMDTDPPANAPTPAGAPGSTVPAGTRGGSSRNSAHSLFRLSSAPAGRRRHHLRQDDRGREHVGARIQRKSGRLLGRHVTGRSGNRVQPESHAGCGRCRSP